MTCIAVVDLPVPPFSFPNTMTRVLRTRSTGACGLEMPESEVVISSTTVFTFCLRRDHGQAAFIQTAVS